MENKNMKACLICKNKKDFLRNLKFQFKIKKYKFL